MNAPTTFRLATTDECALYLAALLVRGFEQYRRYAYPDPESDLAKATRGARWGFEPAQQILDQLPATITALRGDPWTVGYGATGLSIGPATEWDEAKAESSLQFTLRQFQAGVHRLVTVPMTAWQQAALISFSYNVGLDEDADDIAEGLGDSTLLRIFNKGNAALAATHFEDWLRAGSGHPPGLVTRRKAERAMFEGTHPAVAGVRNQLGGGA